MAPVSDYYSQESIDLLTINFIPGLGDILIKQLVAYTGSPSEVLQSRKKALEKIPGIGPASIQALLDEKDAAKQRAHEELTKLEKVGAHMWTYLDAGFPSRLKAIPDGPPLLFTKGNFHFEHPRILAIVGTRQATSYGKDAIHQFMEELVPYNPLIISGLAYGIDIAAHKTALSFGLENWAVMATGIDKVYPSIHKSVAEQLCQNGGLITENPVGTKPDAPRFPARNRIIAGLADAIWVVEAIEKGGALITARLGNDYFKDVFALPGNINQNSSVGCNWLIQKNMAAVVTSGVQLAESMNWTLDGVVPTKNKESKGIPEGIGGNERQILEVMHQVGDIQLDELAWRIQIPVNELAATLLHLEFMGLVRSLPGKKFGRA